MELRGLALIADTTGNRSGSQFRAINPTTGEYLEPEFSPQRFSERKTT
jgi:hypothetical protein